jgi:hypothetical protein
MAKTKRVALAKPADDDDAPAEYTVGTWHDAALAKAPIETLEEALAIDEHALDEALIRQPDAFYRVSKKLAMELSIRDAAKQALQEEEAYADERARSSIPEGEKVTETSIKSLVRLDKKVLAATDKLLMHNRRVAMLQALKEAFQQRSYVMKDLVSLYVANYFGDTSGGRSETQLRTRRADENRTAMAEERRKLGQRERIGRRHESDD